MRRTEQGEEKGARVGGLAGWLLSCLRRAPRETRKLVLLERITLAPRQSLALIEAEGQRLLVATGAEGGTAIYALDGRTGSQRPKQTIGSKSAGRISW